MAAEPGTAPMAPPEGGTAGGGQSAQILQQIEELLMQLAQSDASPEVQSAVQELSSGVEALQQVVGSQDMQNMQSGLNNPGAPGEGAAGLGLGEAGGSPAEEAGESPTEEGAEGGPTHEVEIHIRPSSFKGARQAAMATHRERGHFDRSTPKGKTPQTDRTKNKAKG